MNGIKHATMALAAGAILAALPTSSQAGVSYFNMSYYTDYGVKMYAQGNYHDAVTTAFSADLTAGAALPSSHTDPFLTFCMDINQGLGSGWWKSGTFSDVTLISQSTPAIRQADGLYRAASLYAHYANGIMSVVGNGTGYAWVDKAKGAALQLAIWDVLYDTQTSGTWSVDKDGRADADQFYVTSVNSSVRTLANQMLASQWNTADYSLTMYFWNAVTSSTGQTSRGSQDLIGPQNPIPEPTACIAGCLLLLPFLASTLRRKS